MVGAEALFEDGVPVGLVLQVLEDDGDVVFLEFAFAELGEEGRFCLPLQGVDVGLADLLLLAEDGVGHFRAGDPFDDGAGLGLRHDKVDFRLGFARGGDEFLDRRDDRLDRLVGELQRFDEAGLGQLVGRAFDHQHVLFVADIDQIEVRLEHLLDRRIGDELAVDLADAQRGDRALPRNVGERERGRRAVDHGDVGFMRLIGGEEDAEDLYLVEESGGEKRAAGSVAQAGREDLLLGGTAFTFEEAGGNATGGGVFFPVINGEREVVLAGLHRRSDRGGDEDGGFADGDGDRTVGEFGEGAGRELDAKSGNGDSMFLIHGSDGSPRSRRARASCAAAGETRQLLAPHGSAVPGAGSQRFLTGFRSLHP